MNPADQSATQSPGRARTYALPIAAGAVIAAGGLIFGGLTAANANGSSSHHKTIRQQAEQVQREDAATPHDGNTEMNVNVLEDQIEHYYGSASHTYKGIGKVTIPAKNGPYAQQMHRITARSADRLAAAKKNYQGSKKPAVVFDIDDTLVNTYDYTLSAQFGYDPAENQIWINDAAFPAVPGMPKLVREARNDGYNVFFITGRPESQRKGTVKDLRADGYGTPEAGHLFLKPSTPPAYLNCPAAGCSTTQYKSGTRRHISSEGYAILADFGDQYSDLLGDDTGFQVKLPNPMYYIP